jgi:hypothetical protein
MEEKGENDDDDDEAANGTNGTNGDAKEEVEEDEEEDVVKKYGLDKYDDEGAIFDFIGYHQEPILRP